MSIPFGRVGDETYSRPKSAAACNSNEDAQKDGFVVLLLSGFVSVPIAVRLDAYNDGAG